MDFSKKLQQEVDKYNAIVEREHEANKALSEVREERIVAYGRVKATEELLHEQLKETSLAQSNGHVDPEIVDAEVVEKLESNSDAS